MFLVYFRVLLSIVQFVPMVKSLINMIDLYLDRKAKEKLAKELDAAAKKAIETGDTSDLEKKL